MVPINKIKPLSPIKVKVNLRLIIKSVCLFIISFLLWVLLIGGSIHVLVNYFYLVKTNGFLHPETIKFAVYIIIGAYVFLILDKKKVYEAFGIKKGLPYITVEQIQKTKEQNG